MKRRATARTLGILSLLICSRAGAGLLNSPPPTFDGAAPGIVVFRMGSVYYEAEKVDTVVKCTNLADQSTPVAFEIFDAQDTLIGAVTRASVPAGETVTFATSAAADASGAEMPPALPTIDHGKARVSATTAKLSCSGDNRIRATDGSVKRTMLTLVKKVAY